MKNYVIIKILLLSFLIIASSALQTGTNEMETIWHQTTNKKTLPHTRKQKSRTYNRPKLFRVKNTPSTQSPTQIRTASSHNDVREEINSIYLFLKDFINNMKLGNTEEIDHIDILYRKYDEQFLEVFSNSLLADEYREYIHLIPTEDNSILDKGVRVAVEIFAKPKLIRKKAKL